MPQATVTYDTDREYVGLKYGDDDDYRWMTPDVARTFAEVLEVVADDPDEAAEMAEEEWMADAAEGFGEDPAAAKRLAHALRTRADEVA